MAISADSQTTLSNGSSAISLSSPSPIKHKPQYNAESQAIVAYESEGACVSCCVAFFYLIGMVLIVIGIGATALITQYPEHVLYLAMAGASGIILGLIFVSLSATMCRPRRRRVVDAKSDMNGNASNQHNGKARPPLGASGAHGPVHGLPSTNRYEVRAGGSADVIDDNIVLSSSPKMHQHRSNMANTTASTDSTMPPFQNSVDCRTLPKSMAAPMQLKFANKPGGHQPPTSIGDFTISAHHSYGTLPPAYLTLNGHGHIAHMGIHAHLGSNQYPADISAHSLVNSYALDAGHGPNNGVNLMAPALTGVPTHPSDEGHAGLMMIGHSSLRNGNPHSTATLPLPGRVRSSVSYNDVLLEEPRRVGIHILRQREASSSDGLESNGSDDPRSGQGQHVIGGHPQGQATSSESDQQLSRPGVQPGSGGYSQQQMAGLAPVREMQTHNSTSSDERSSPRSDYFSKESSIASTEHRQQAAAATHQMTQQGMQSMNTIGLPQPSPRKKPPEVAPKPFMIPNVANLRPVLPQIVQPSFYGRMTHPGVPGYHQGGQGGPDTSYASIDHTGAMSHPANVVALSDEDAARNDDLLETQI